VSLAGLGPEVVVATAVNSGGVQEEPGPGPRGWATSTPYRSAPVELGWIPLQARSRPERRDSPLRRRSCQPRAPPCQHAVPRSRVGGRSEERDTCLQL